MLGPVSSVSSGDVTSGVFFVLILIASACFVGVIAGRRWLRARRATAQVRGTVEDVFVRSAGKRRYRLIVSYSFEAEGSFFGDDYLSSFHLESGARRMADALKESGFVTVSYESGHPENSTLKMLAIDAEHPPVLRRAR